MDNVKFMGSQIDVPMNADQDKHRLPEWVKCYKCGKPPAGFNWLKPVSTDPDCRQLIHLDCIQRGLSRMFDHMGGRA